MNRVASSSEDNRSALLLLIENVSRANSACFHRRVSVCQPVVLRTVLNNRLMSFLFLVIFIIIFWNFCADETCIFGFFLFLLYGIVVLNLDRTINYYSWD